jgi:hypothetical protein
MAKLYVQTNTVFQAGAGSAIGAVSITLTSLTDIYTNVLTMANFGDKGYITLEPDTTNEEGATFTGIVANANGTYTLTGVSTILAKSPYTETSGLIRTHSGGTKVVVTDNVAFWNTFANKTNDETISGQWTFTVTPISPTGGVSDASTTVKGVSKMSTAPSPANNPIAVSTTDPAYIAGAGSQGVPSITNKFITQDNTSSIGADQSQTTQNGTQTVGMADTTGLANKVSQSFLPTRTTMSGMKLYKSADTGTFVGTVKVALQADTAGSPSGADLASVTLTNAQWLALVIGEFSITFTTEYSAVVAGSLYWTVITTSTSDSSNHPNLGINTGGGYANGTLKRFNTTDNWVTIATSKLYFKTVEGILNQVVKTNSLGQLPAFDGSNLTNISSAFISQEILFGNGNNTTNPTILTSSQDGTILFCSSLAPVGSGILSIFRLKKDIKTGVFIQTHSTNLTITTNNIFSMACTTTKLYIYCQVGGVYSMRQYSISDLTGVASMTGVPSGAGGASIFSDGSDVYISSGTSTYDRYTISGTVMTNAATITYTSTSAQPCAICDGTNVWFSNASGTSVLKYPKTGGAQTSTTSFVINNTLYYLGSQISLFMGSSSNLGFGWGYAVSSDVTPVVQNMARLIAVTLP